MPSWQSLETLTMWLLPTPWYCLSINLMFSGHLWPPGQSGDGRWRHTRQWGAVLRPRIGKCWLSQMVRTSRARAGSWAERVFEQVRHMDTLSPAPQTPRLTLQPPSTPSQALHSPTLEPNLELTPYLPFNSHHPHTPPTPMTPPTITAGQVRRGLQRLHRGKATGPNDMIMEVLKAYAVQLCGVLQHMGNLSLRLEKVPTLWKFLI